MLGTLMKKIAIIGSHGLYAKYGGWDQLVNNLAEKKTDEYKYIIFNSRDTPLRPYQLDNVIVKRSIFKASGFEGLFFDFLTIFQCFYFVDIILFLGVQGLPLVPFLLPFKKTEIVCNSGGIEWERKKFGYFAKLYLRFCFKLSLKFSKNVILDNEHFKEYLPKKSDYKAKVNIIPYGGEIDFSLKLNDKLISKYPFLIDEYYLSVNRSFKDNMILELCNVFENSSKRLVLISNLTASKYGRNIIKRFCSTDNIILIDGLYIKSELDLIRRHCLAYIHTHTSCGTAPSLVEMIISRRPIISIDYPQNRYTLNNQGLYFKNFKKLKEIIENQLDVRSKIKSKKLIKEYSWDLIVSKYQSLY
jgi:glycosyltransferase involved in cell wall biosynthesis